MNLTFLSLVINFLFPLRCLSCSEFIAIPNAFCAECWQKFNFIAKPYCNLCGSMLAINIQEVSQCGQCLAYPPPFASCRSLIKFDEHSKKIIHAFKYYDKTILAKLFANLLLQRYTDHFSAVDIIAPVPMNKLKRLFRLYNHSHILAKEIAYLMKKPLYPDLLIKTKWTKPQSALSKSERENNLANSLEFNSKYNINNHSILLVDDVLTTGTTIKKCSIMLKNSGASAVHVFTIART